MSDQRFACGCRSHFLAAAGCFSNDSVCSCVSVSLSPVKFMHCVRSHEANSLGFIFELLENNEGVVHSSSVTCS